MTHRGCHFAFQNDIIDTAVTEFNIFNLKILKGYYFNTKGYFAFFILLKK